MKIHAKNYQAGFTLIEVIVSLVVAAIMASMIYTYFGNALTQSSVPIARLQKASNLYQVMENIVTDYNRLNNVNLRYKWRSNHMYKIGAIVLPSDTANNITSKIENNGRYYICTVAGTSNTTTIPSWPTPGNLTDTVIEGTGMPTWKEEGYVWKASTTYPANAIVVPALNNGHFYKGPSAVFTTTANEPTWPISATVTETGGPQWTEVGTILARTDMNDNLTYYLTNDQGRYGTGYSVVAGDTIFVRYNGNTEEPACDPSCSEKKILKVTINNNDSAETLMQIFTIH